MNLIPLNMIMRVAFGDIETLPMVSQWSSLVMLVEEVLVWSAEDLRCMFYLFHMPKGWLRYQAFNKVSPTKLIPAGCKERCVLASRVLGVGFASSVGIAQHLKCQILLGNPNHELALPKKDFEIRKDSPLFPEAKAYWKAYLDNWDELRVVHREAARQLSGTPSPWQKVARVAYEKWKAPTHPKKAVMQEMGAESPGAWIDGDKGNSRAKGANVAKYMDLSFLHSFCPGAAGGGWRKCLCQSSSQAALEHLP